MASSNAGKPIRIAPYNAEWPRRFATERDLIYAACGRNAFTTIEHVGSTAVPGLGAKPIIDMMPGLVSLTTAPPVIAALQTIGYVYVPEFEQPNQFDDGMPFRRYLRKDAAGERAFHVHMVEDGSEFWERHLLFRDFLRAHPDERNAYERLKRALAEEFNANLTPASNVNNGYTDRKTEFVETRIARARAWRESA